MGETNGEDGEVEKHLQGKHDQETHGGRGSSSTNRPGSGRRISISDHDFLDLMAKSGGEHVIGRALNGSPIFTVERQTLHDRIVSDAVNGISPVENVTYTILGEGPASGKSTMVGAGHISDVSNVVSVNPDDVKEQLPEYKERVASGDSDATNFVHEESSYVSKRISKAAMELNKNVILDGPGDSSVRSLTAKIEGAQKMGYTVK